MAQLSTWRNIRRNLLPGLNEIIFNDTRPNVFLIINNNNTYLYGSLNSIPTDKKYEHAIKPNDSDVMGRPLPVSRIYIFNPKNVTVQVEIFSDYTHFDMALLKSIYAHMDDEQLEKIKYDGVITGWQTPDVVNTFITNADDIFSPINDNIDQNSDNIYTLIDNFKSNVITLLNNINDNNINTVSLLYDSITGTYPRFSTLNYSLISFQNTNKLMLSGINKSITNFNVMTSYMLSGISKMSNMITLLDGILNKQCNCGGGGSGSTTPDTPVTPETPTYDKNDYIITETYNINENGVITINDVEKLQYVHVYDYESNNPISEIEIIASNKNFDPKKIMNDSYIYQDMSGTIEIFHKGLISTPQGISPYKIDVKYYKTGINKNDIVTSVNKNIIVSIVNLNPTNKYTYFYNVYNPYVIAEGGSTLTIQWQGSVKYSKQIGNFETIETSDLANFTNGENLSFQCTDGELKLTVKYN